MSTTIKTWIRNIYKALDATKHPNITFTFQRLFSISLKYIAGNVRIAGTPRDCFTSRLVPASNGLVLKVYSLTMKDYNIDHNSTFGTIKTGNEVTLNEWYFWPSTKIVGTILTRY